MSDDELTNLQHRIVQLENQVEEAVSHNNRMRDAIYKLFGKEAFWEIYNETIRKEIYEEKKSFDRRSRSQKTYRP